MGGVCRAIKRFCCLIAVTVSLASVQLVYASDGPNLTWSQLTEQQQTVLKPLAKEWDSLRRWQRAKMLDIAKDFTKMSASQQALVQQRLTQWSRMTPYEREQARKYHQQFEALSAEEQAAIKKQWQAYEKLPEAERAKLRNGAHPDTLATE